jgi:DNA-binding GntR family transcriptional regulator
MFEYLSNWDRLTYQAFADEIKRKISSGELACGEKLPTLSQLCSQTGLASYSVRKAIYFLVNSGILRTEQGGGVYISENTK